MGSHENPEIDGPVSFRAAFGVSRETIEKLETYADLLKRWQKTINLVAPSTLASVWHRHFADSAQLWRYTPPRKGEGDVHWLDLGSGAGFPGMVIAILAAETGGTRHTLIESDSRKAAFLREVARAVAVPVDIVCARIEILETRARVSRVDRVTARALAPLPLLLELVFPYFASDTVGVFAKGRESGSEIDEAHKRFDFDAELHPSLTDASGRVLIVRNLRPKA
jgi:16S rRNA (guanine527-N7)-methyltransferase